VDRHRLLAIMVFERCKGRIMQAQWQLRWDVRKAALAERESYRELAAKCGCLD
jgi:hypothetical protein